MRVTEYYARCAERAAFEITLLPSRLCHDAAAMILRHADIPPAYRYTETCPPFSLMLPLLILPLPCRYAADADAWLRRHAFFFYAAIVAICRLRHADDAFCDEV